MSEDHVWIADGRGQVCPNGHAEIPYGIEVRGVYDGVLIWQCPICKVMWPRFEEGTKRWEQAMDYIGWQKVKWVPNE